MARDVQIRAMPMRACFDIKGPKDVVGRALGEVALPSRPNTRSEYGPIEVHWFGAESWILTAPLGSEEEWIDRFGGLAEEPDLLVLTVSDLHSFVEISGEHSEEVLASAVSLDLRRLGTDASLFTDVFGQKGLLVRRTGSHEIAVENSLTEFLLTRFRTEAGQLPGNW